MVVIRALHETQEAVAASAVPVVVKTVSTPQESVQLAPDPAPALQVDTYTTSELMTVVVSVGCADRLAEMVGTLAVVVEALVTEDGKAGEASELELVTLGRLELGVGF